MNGSLSQAGVDGNEIRMTGQTMRPRALPSVKREWRRDSPCALVVESGRLRRSSPRGTATSMSARWNRGCVSTRRREDEASDRRQGSFSEFGSFIANLRTTGSIAPPLPVARRIHRKKSRARPLFWRLLLCGRHAARRLVDEDPGPAASSLHAMLVKAEVYSS